MLDVRLVVVLTKKFRLGFVAACLVVACGSGSEPGNVVCFDGNDLNPNELGVGVPYCSCSSRPAPSSTHTQYAGIACGYPLADQLCCADEAFPTSGYCACTEIGPWRCTAPSVGDCFCAYELIVPNQPLTTECNSNTPTPTIGVPGGTPWSCCENSEDLCRCTEDVGDSVSDAIKACEHGLKVTDCRAAGAQAPAPAMTCPRGQKQVSSCSTGPTTP